MQRTAILVDGAYFLARYRKVYPDRDATDARAVAHAVFGMALDHIKQLDRSREALYRIFFYDCAPLQRQLVRPVSGENMNLGTSAMANFRRELHDCLRRQRKLVLRLGRLVDRGGQWSLKRSAYDALHDGTMAWGDLGDEHFEPDLKQSQVDMKIGIDIAALAYKGQVDQIVLIAGDSDFVPAAKLARREGIDFILDPMWQGVAPVLHEHIDGLQSVCPRPR